MEPKSHWENVYATKAATAVSWFQAHADLSLRLIAETGASTDASIIDVGGGAPASNGEAGGPGSIVVE